VGCARIAVAVLQISPEASHKRVKLFHPTFLNIFEFIVLSAFGHPNATPKLIQLSFCPFGQDLKNTFDTSE